MCLVALHWAPGTEWPLWMIANRDEFRARPTEALHWWRDSDTDILAGRDLKAGGTWFGTDRSGRFALVTNIRPGYVGKSGALSRGELPVDFLSRQQDIEAYHSEVSSKIEEYSGFNLILGDLDRLFWFSSDHPSGRWLAPGIHVLSNDALNTAWPKAELARQQMDAALPALYRGEPSREVLHSTETFPEDRLPQTGVSPEWERMLSAQTITSEEYGTLSRSWLGIDSERNILVQEAQLDREAKLHSLAQFNWQI